MFFTSVKKFLLGYDVSIQLPSLITFLDRSKAWFCLVFEFVRFTYKRTKQQIVNLLKYVQG